jgi:hypothetical protein
MGHSILATTAARRDRYAAEGRDCRMDGRCYSRGTHVVTVLDGEVGAWTFCRKHAQEFVSSALHFGYCNAANPESRLLSVIRMERDENGDEARARVIALDTKALR